jgi:hypothetical protein
MLMRAGAILPLAPLVGTTDALPGDRLILSVFPGADGLFRLYEDDGITPAYQSGEYEWTEITTQVAGENTWVVHVAPVEGRCNALPDQREYEIRLEGSRQPQRVTIDGEETTNWTYRPETLTTIIQVPKRDKRAPLAVVAVAEGAISALGEARNRRLVLSDVQRLLGDACPRDAGDVDAVLGLDVPGRADAVARLGGPFARVIEFVTPEESAQTLGRVIVGGPAHADEPYDVEVMLTHDTGGEVEEHVVHLPGAVGSQIIDLPIAFDGRVRPMRWEAVVTMRWRGETLRVRHRSQPLFPSIHTWRALVYDQKESKIPLAEVMDVEGNLNETLAWTIYSQTSEGLRNVVQAHTLHLSTEYEEILKTGASLAGYLVTTINSPDERDVILAFRSAGPDAFYLNGAKVVVIPLGADEAELHPVVRGLSRTELMHLRAGKNTLLVDSRPSPKNQLWMFSGVLLTPEGEPMTDLAFD